METATHLPATALVPENKEIRIFIVDDDPMYRQFLELQLGKHPSYRVFSLKTGEECLRQIHTLSPDIVILDYRLNDEKPGAMNGLNVLKRLKAQKPGIHVLMLSGQDSFEVAAQSIKYGAYDYIVKNESAFVRIHKLITNIIRQHQLQKKLTVQKKYFQLMVLSGAIIICAPAVLHYVAPESFQWALLTILSGYIILTILIYRLKSVGKLTGETAAP